MSEEFMYKWEDHQQLQIMDKQHFENANYALLLFFLFQPFAYFFFIVIYYKFKKFWKNQEILEEKSERPIVKPQVKYEDKYIEEYKKIEPVVLSTERLDSLKHTFLVENTPFGNLMMHYDHSRESFVYYSDNTIPYRFLEVASRRYVVQNNCKTIHVSMADELTEAEKKLQEKRKREKEQEKEKEKEKEEEKDKTSDEPVKKNVFAKLKNYNTSSVRAPNATKPKANANTNSRPMPTNSKTEENTNIIVKEKANRYSYEGKFANFGFLQKVDKKTVDKRYEMSFAEFKKMCSSKK
jgi:hypothetical protein